MSYVKCYKVTPGPSRGFDNQIVIAGASWKPALELIEASLESQFLRMEDEGGRWSDIELKVECVELTEEELDGLEDE
jgi:hypothetical protein